MAVPNLYGEILTGRTAPTLEGNLQYGIQRPQGPKGDDGNILFVDITYDKYYNCFSSHSASEIKKHLNNGGFVVGRYENADIFIDDIKDDNVVFVQHGPTSNTFYAVYEDKTVMTMVKTVVDYTAKYVRSVNGILPDKNGNVEIPIPEAGGNVGVSVDGETLVFAESSTATIENETLIL